MGDFNSDSSSPHTHQLKGILSHLIVEFTREALLGLAWLTCLACCQTLWSRGMVLSWTQLERSVPLDDHLDGLSGSDGMWIVILSEKVK